MNKTDSKSKKSRTPHTPPRPGAVMLTRRQVADILSVSCKQLAEMAAVRQGPPFCKLGPARNSAVRYPAAMLQTWIDEHMVASKGEA